MQVQGIQKACNGYFGEHVSTKERALLARATLVVDRRTLCSHSLSLLLCPSPSLFAASVYAELHSSGKSRIRCVFQSPWHCGKQLMVQLQVQLPQNAI